MKTSIAVVLSGVVVFAGVAGARQEQPGAAAAQPAAKADKPRVYDEKADAKEQIAAAVARAKQQNRRVLVQWGGNWCGWCVKLHELYKSNREVAKELLYEYDVVYVDSVKDGKNMDLAKSYGADLATHGVPFLTVLDAKGAAVANQETAALEVNHKIDGGHDAGKLLAFLKANQAAYLPAQRILDDGVAQAKAAGKRVFLHFGAPWCVWCHRMEDWMARPEIGALLAKDYIDVRVDVDRTVGGKELKAKFTGGKEGGIPWFVILDVDGKPLATSDDSDGNNIGFPSKPKEVEHFCGMLTKTASRLSADDVKAIAASLSATQSQQSPGH